MQVLLFERGRVNHSGLINDESFSSLQAQRQTEILNEQCGQ
jgi:hypothetical protein